LLFSGGPAPAQSQAQHQREEYPSPSHSGEYNRETPCWQRKETGRRISGCSTKFFSHTGVKGIWAWITNELINQLRRELWAQALSPQHFSDFMAEGHPDQKSEKCDVPLVSAAFPSVN
jgi:hypothetical protein